MIAAVHDRRRAVSRPAHDTERGGTSEPAQDLFAFQREAFEGEGFKVDVMTMQAEGCLDQGAGGDSSSSLRKVLRRMFAPSTMSSGWENSCGE